MHCHLYLCNAVQLHVSPKLLICILLQQGSDDYIVQHPRDSSDIVFFLFKNSLGSNKKKVMH